MKMKPFRGIEPNESGVLRLYCERSLALLREVADFYGTEKVYAAGVDSVRICDPTKNLTSPLDSLAWTPNISCFGKGGRGEFASIKSQDGRIVVIHREAPDLYNLLVIGKDGIGKDGFVDSSSCLSRSRVEAILA